MSDDDISIIGKKAIPAPPGWLAEDNKLCMYDIFIVDPA